MQSLTDVFVKGKLVCRIKLPADSLNSFYQLDNKYYSIITNSISSKIMKQEETSLSKMKAIIALNNTDNVKF